MNLKRLEFVEKGRAKMTVEGDDYGDFHGGTYDDGEQG
jgi:hypothetical protein